VDKWQGLQRNEEVCLEKGKYVERMSQAGTIEIFLSSPRVLVG